MRPNGRDDDGVSFHDAEALVVTPKALLCRLADAREVWVPLSVITDDSEVFGCGDVGELVVRSWFARKEGLC